MPLGSRNEKVEALRGRLRQLPGALVAFSGGADSAFLLALALEEIGGQVVALTAVSASLAPEERIQAEALARRLGVRQLQVESHEIEDPDYAKNPVNRCYHCKRELYGLCRTKAQELGIAAILDGFNADDRHDHRPGHLAALEAGILSPLADAELTKQEIREESLRLGLSTWDKPASPCLASRIPYGVEVTPERLHQIGSAEADLRALGLREFRVRYHGEIARLELGETEWDQLLRPELRRQLDAALRARGFQFVAIDLLPFRSGRLNTNLSQAGIRS